MNDIVIIIASLLICLTFGWVVAGLQVGIYWMGCIAVGTAVGEFINMVVNLKEKK